MENFKSTTSIFILVFMFEKILIATDGSKHSEKAAIAAIELSQLTKGKVTALYVEDREKKGIEATERIKEMAGKAGIPFEAKIVEGNPANEILKFAEDAKMDVIVIGSIGVTGLKKFMIGSVAEKVVLHSKMPVLTVYWGFWIIRRIRFRLDQAEIIPRQIFLMD